MERKIHQMQRRLFTLLHRELFCYIDKWYGLSLDQVREYEHEAVEELTKVKNKECIFSRVHILFLGFFPQFKPFDY